MESFEHCGLTVEIKQDEDPRNPREDYDPLGKMICFHKRYNLGDKHNYRSEDYNGWEEMEAAIIKNEHAAVILPIYMMDHSGLSISTSDSGFRACDSAGWDWGQIGFICISKEKAQEEGRKLGWNPYGKLTKATLAKITKYLIEEVEEYNQFLSGDVWGYIIIDKDGEDDSCWGLPGYDYCIKEAKRVAEWIAFKKCKPSVYGSVTA
jgi:hypothetical protein